MYPRCPAHHIWLDSLLTNYEDKHKINPSKTSGMSPWILHEKRAGNAGCALSRGRWRAPPWAGCVAPAHWIDSIRPLLSAIDREPNAHGYPDITDKTSRWRDLSCRRHRPGCAARAAWAMTSAREIAPSRSFVCNVWISVGIGFAINRAQEGSDRVYPVRRRYATSPRRGAPASPR